MTSTIAPHRWSFQGRPSAGDLVLAGTVTLLALAAATDTIPVSLGDGPVLLLVVVAAGSLAVRCIYPLAVLALVIAGTVFFSLDGQGYWPVAAVIAIYSTGAHTPRPRAAVAGGLAVAAVTVAVAAQLDWRPLSWETVVTTAGAMLPLVAAWVAGVCIRARRERIPGA
jgi:hypothetical protein